MCMQMSKTIMQHGRKLGTKIMSVIDEIESGEGGKSEEKEGACVCFVAAESLKEKTTESQAWKKRD